MFFWALAVCGFVSVAAPPSQEFATMRAFANDAYTWYVYMIVHCYYGLVGVCEIVPTGCEKHETTNRAPVSVRLFFARRVVRCCASMFFSSLCRYRVERAVRSTCVHTNRRMDDVVPLVFRIENAVRSDVLFVL